MEKSDVEINLKLESRDDMEREFDSSTRVSGEVQATAGEPSRNE